MPCAGSATWWKPTGVPSAWSWARLAAAGSICTPVVFDCTGHGRQAELGAGCFDDPPESFTEGMLGAVVVPCLSREQQVRFHRAYDPRAIDLHYLRLLDGIADSS